MEMTATQRVDVERFTVYGDASIRRSENGNFVKHEAYAALLQQLAEQTRQLAKCFVLAGADTDGRNDASFAPDAVRAVNDLRHDYDEACNEAEKLRAKLSERDADVADLREAFALKHAAIILMRDVANGHKARAEAAERAREGDRAEMAKFERECRIYQGQHERAYADHQMDGRESYHPGRALANTFKWMGDRIAAFLAANGGQDHG